LLSDDDDDVVVSESAGLAWKEHSWVMISSWKNGLVFEQSLGNAEKN